MGNKVWGMWTGLSCSGSSLLVSLLANTAKCDAKTEPVFLVCVDDEEEVI